MAEEVLNFYLVNQLFHVFFCVRFCYGFLGVETFCNLLLGEVYKWVRSNTDGFDSEEEKLFLGLGDKHVLLVNCRSSLL